MGRDPERNKIPRNPLWTGPAARASLASDKTAIMRCWQQGRKTASDRKPSPERWPPGKHGHLEKHGGGLAWCSLLRAGRSKRPTFQVYHNTVYSDG